MTNTTQTSLDYLRFNIKDKKLRLLVDELKVIKTINKRSDQRVNQIKSKHARATDS